MARVGPEKQVANMVLSVLDVLCALQTPFLAHVPHYCTGGLLCSLASGWSQALGGSSRTLEGGGPRGHPVCSPRALLVTRLMVVSLALLEVTGSVWRPTPVAAAPFSGFPAPSSCPSRPRALSHFQVVFPKPCPHLVNLIVPH